MTQLRKTIVAIPILLASWTNAGAANESAPKKPVKLPGLVIDFGKRCVDLEASICLDKGFLELIACTKGSKEHESIVAVVARPRHIHTALLLLGANNGNPAMRKQVGEKQKRWVIVEPHGDPIEVSLVIPNADGKNVERPITDFVTRAGDNAQPAKAEAFPSKFLFAGSHLRDRGEGPRLYLADKSGHVISIATFGDELLCLPGIRARDNTALTWRVDPKHLPKVGTKVTLRLRPKKARQPGAKK